MLIPLAVVLCIQTLARKRDNISTRATIGCIG